ncbi:MAG TPA: putative metal-dependent hydrolase, partial [Chitinophagaceae bacterium]|nr:putative metal-dependent hydrolase [Chitinophagaceae bacterium]
DPRFPIGEYEPKPFSIEKKIEWLADLKFLPSQLENAVLNLDEHQLQTPYREGGWTIQQLVHHVADSHINAYCRFKLALTEENPTIKPYDEKLWADMKDVQKLPINISLTLLHALHARWYESLKYISDNDWNNRAIFHPDQKKMIRLWTLLGMYAWHGKHHVAHILTLRDQMKW